MFIINHCIPGRLIIYLYYISLQVFPPAHGNYNEIMFNILRLLTRQRQNQTTGTRMRRGRSLTPTRSSLMGGWTTSRRWFQVISLKSHTFQYFRSLNGTKNGQWINIMNYVRNCLDFSNHSIWNRAALLCRINRQDLTKTGKRAPYKKMLVYFRPGCNETRRLGRRYGRRVGASAHRQSRLQERGRLRRLDTAHDRQPRLQGTGFKILLKTIISRCILASPRERR